MLPPTLDVSRSEVRVFTRTRGMLSPIAHDLELRAVPEACARTEQSVTAEFRVDRVKVAGAVRGGVSRTDILSPKDVAEIERRIGHDVFGGCRSVTVTATVEGAEARLGVSVGASKLERRVALTVTEEGAAQTVQGECVLSLKGLGIKAPRGPLGVFEVADEVRVTFRCVWV